MSRFTKMAITEAFVELLNKRPLDKITVKDIVDRCEINRNTFYYYYQDIYALLEEILQEEIQKIHKSKTAHHSWQEGLLAAIQFALTNRQAVFHVYNSSRREELEQYFYQVIGRAMDDYIQEKAGDLPALEEDLQILRDFYTYALAGMISQWIRGGMKGEPDQMIQRLGLLLDGHIRDALEKGIAFPP
jgi:AcrR family transcriptional regulator